MLKRLQSRTLVAAVFIVSAVAATFEPNVPTNIAVAQAGSNEVPFGDKVGPAVTKYNRLRPTIATAGPLKDSAISELKSLGFATILDLRGPDEGTDVEKVAVEAAGLRYLNIPVTLPCLRTRRWPTLHASSKMPHFFRC